MTEKSCPHCGGLLHRPRSGPDHRRFFALIQAAFEQWPETHDFQPDTAEHLRKWLLCTAGFRERVDIAVPFADDEPAVAKLAAIAIQSALEAAGAYAFVRPDPKGGRVAVYKARSIAWDKIGQKEFAEIRTAIEEIIEAELRVSPDQLLREKAA